MKQKLQRKLEAHSYVVVYGDYRLRVDVHGDGYSTVDVYLDDRHVDNEIMFDFEVGQMLESYEWMLENGHLGEAI